MQQSDAKAVSKFFLLEYQFGFVIFLNPTIHIPHLVIPSPPHDSQSATTNGSQTATPLTQVFDEILH